ncbi:50S ribosomal protein L23 [bacterium]|nr:50S ribosomal protein L23 [bacterium]|tara:strand:+ start:1542 stop:1910 length:369 start_codon:yes stop_codon:yes gene_type:complete
MALFSRNTKEDKATKTASASKSAERKAASRDLSSVLLKPRVTEKAVKGSEKNVYTFLVKRDATKYDVKDAVKALYNVTPVRVNIVNKHPRQYMSRSKGRVVAEKGMKKAYVYLRDGDSITLV